jgi:hypothetical protein
LKARLLPIADMDAVAAILAFDGGRPANQSNFGILVPLKGKLTRVVEHENFFVRP